MTTRTHLHRLAQAIAIALASLALAAPASMARPADDAGVWDGPHPSQRWGTESSILPKSMADLTESEVLASRGKGAPRPVIRTAGPAEDAGSRGFAPLTWAFGVGITLTLAALAARALAGRRRAGVTA